MKAWSVAIGNINPLRKSNRDAVKYISKLNGFVGFFPHYPQGTLCFFAGAGNCKKREFSFEYGNEHTFNPITMPDFNCSYGERRDT